MVHVDAYVQRREDFKAKNVHLLFIGNGVPAKAKEYMKTLGIHEGELYTDEERVTYQALNFDNPSFFKMISLKGIKLSREASSKGFKVDTGSGTGSWTQLGGVVVVDSNKVNYFHKSKTPFDYPEPDDVLPKL
eukprot:TRINITY_DN3395_c0_g1_i1.p1 TRINITY_DN3395_c0_g1~~TRINITY_DN3395_c0_g1_i1.p1  ORF type:complete len:133 (-),score=25.18 TRINITY_DN3395_c0_g1_i1:341-739(-)